MAQLKHAHESAFGSLAASTVEATAALLEERLAPLFVEPFDHERAALYVVSSNAGISCAVEFWSEARRVGLAVASPALFPSTLANSPCGALARRFQICGPTHTFTGRAVALSAAFTQLGDDLANGRISTGWLCAIDFATPSRRRTLFSALRTSDATAAADDARSSAQAQASQRCAAALLRRMLARNSQR